MEHDIELQYQIKFQKMKDNIIDGQKDIQKDKGQGSKWQDSKVYETAFDQQMLDDKRSYDYKYSIQKGPSSLPKQKIGQGDGQQVKMQYYRKKMKESMNWLISNYRLDQIIGLNMVQIYKKIQQNKELQSYQKWYISQFYQINDIISKIKQLKKEEIQNRVYEMQVMEQVNQKKVYLKQKKQKILVLDMDETLIHCKLDSKPPYDHKFKYYHQQSQTCYELSFYVRPFLEYFLQQMSEIYQIVVFTAGNQSYADPILDYIDPKGQYISCRLYRPSCVMNQLGYFVKDLRIFQNVALNDIILVDNNVYSFMNQLNNGVPIINFYDDKQDIELLELSRYLKHLYFCKEQVNVLEFGYKYFFFEMVYKSRSIGNAIYNLVKQ